MKVKSTIDAVAAFSHRRPRPRQCFAFLTLVRRQTNSESRKERPSRPSGASGPMKMYGRRPSRPAGKCWRRGVMLDLINAGTRASLSGRTERSRAKRNVHVAPDYLPAIATRENIAGRCVKLHADQADSCTALAVKGQTTSSLACIRAAIGPNIKYDPSCGRYELVYKSPSSKHAGYDGRVMRSLGGRCYSARAGYCAKTTNGSPRRPNAKTLQQLHASVRVQRGRLAPLT